MNRRERVLAVLHFEKPDFTMDSRRDSSWDRSAGGNYLAENKLLLGSETLGVYGGPGIVLPSYLIGYEITRQSIDKAENMEIETILIPHCGLLDKV